MLLEARGLAKRFGQRTVLNGINLDVSRGEIVGLIGPNGAGKTTLFECLAGLQPVDSGDIRKGPLFYLPDAIRPWPDRRVHSVLTLFEQLHRTTRGGWIDRLHLQQLQQSRVGSLSKGELKRFSVALSLLSAAPLLLLDEPFDGLDLRQTRDMMALLADAPRELGKTLFLSIHQLGDASRACHRLILLTDGRIAGSGTIDELRAAAGLRDGGLEEIFLALA